MVDYKITVVADNDEINQTQHLIRQRPNYETRIDRVIVAAWKITERVIAIKHKRSALCETK